ncbi:hypothetical protein [Streptomyces sp. Ag109_O5-1]|nr:hypothetical protein [Streptomyces sp. Ag109_O5-1]
MVSSFVMRSANAGAGAWQCGQRSRPTANRVVHFGQVSSTVRPP